MTRKHYNALAEIIGKARGRALHEGRLEAHHELIELTATIAAYLETDNPRFHMERFLDYTYNHAAHVHTCLADPGCSIERHENA